MEKAERKEHHSKIVVETERRYLTTLPQPIGPNIKLQQLFFLIPTMSREKQVNDKGGKRFNKAARIIEIGHRPF